MKKSKVITSEYVSYGHPDKVCDQISDALLDAYIEKDPNARVGIETLFKDNIVVVGGEVNSTAKVNVDKIIRNVVEGINYPDSHYLTGDDLKIINLIGRQSPEIAKGVNRDDCDCIGAGDQGFMVGMATNETTEYIPFGVYLARNICQGVARMEGFGPDVKTQVSIDYSDNEPKIVAIVVSTMHKERFDVDVVRKLIKNAIRHNLMSGHPIIDDMLYEKFIKYDDKIRYFINANGEWFVGGPISDCGVTGRKIVVDNYGGYCNVAGGAYSGKDMSKVDRSGAYMCRYLAKNIVAAGLADEARVELSYIISEPQPYVVKVNLKNPKKTVIEDLERQLEYYIKKEVDLTPKGIINRFFPTGIKPIFFETARNGHFGHLYPWEDTNDLANKMSEYIEKVELNLTEI